MSKYKKEEKERLEKINELFFYNIGYENINDTFDKTESLLEEYKDIKVPKSLDEWFDNYQNKLRRKEKKEKRRKTIIRISKQVAMIILIASIAVSLATISVEAFRIKFFNMIVETTEKFSTITHQEKEQLDIQEELPKEWIDYYYPTFLPEGYFLVSAKELNDTKHMIFENELNNEVIFRQSSLSSQTQVDSENGKVIEVDVNGNKGVIIEKKELTILSWNNNEIGFSIHGEIDKTTILEIANNIKKRN